MARYSLSMAALATPEPESRVPAESQIPKEWHPLVMHAAKLYGQGYDRKQIAKVLADPLYSDREWPRESRERAARSRLAKWEKIQWFRDLVWDFAVVELDMSTPQILRGIARKAKRGRVDAAKLALGVTGRYKEKDQDTPSAVTINLAVIPRPDHQAVEADSSMIEIVGED